MKTRKVKKEYCQWHEVMETKAECAMKPTIMPKAERNEVTHTPTPWKVSLRFQNNLPNDYVITDGKWGSQAIAASDSEANAELIVRAVNNHERMLDFIKAYASGNVPDSTLLRFAKDIIAKADGK